MSSTNTTSELHYSFVAKFEGFRPILILNNNMKIDINFEHYTHPSYKLWSNMMFKKYIN